MKYSCIGGHFFNSMCYGQHTLKELTLTIYHYKVPGVGESAQLCYPVKIGFGSKEIFYDQIEGFKYQWDYIQGGTENCADLARAQSGIFRHAVNKQGSCWFVKKESLF